MSQNEMEQPGEASVNTGSSGPDAAAGTAAFGFEGVAGPHTTSEPGYGTTTDCGSGSGPCGSRSGESKSSTGCGAGSGARGTASGHSTASSAQNTVDRLRSELNRVLDAVWTQGEKAIETLNRSVRSEHWSPAVDLLEEDHSLRVVIDLPGCDPAAVDVSIVGNRLLVKGHRHGGAATSGSLGAGGPRTILHRQGRPMGIFEIDVPLPVPVESASAMAESRLGVLTIRIGKKSASAHSAVKVPVQVRSTEGTC